MKKQLKKIPKFRNEEEERAFWARHDSASYIDWRRAKRAVFPNLHPTTKSISLRLPASLLERIKSSANQRDIPYQSYMKMLLHRDVTENMKK